MIPAPPPNFRPAPAATRPTGPAPPELPPGSSPPYSRHPDIHAACQIPVPTRAAKPMNVTLCWLYPLESHIHRFLVYEAVGRLGLEVGTRAWDVEYAAGSRPCRHTGCSLRFLP